VEEPEHKTLEGDERTKELVNGLESRLLEEINYLRLDVDKQFKS
jgi:hypothetical protein